LKLKKLYINAGLRRHPELKAACAQKGVSLI